MPKQEPKPTAPPAIPPPPAVLDRVGREAWRRVARQLYLLGLLTDVDLDMLENRCQVFAELRQLRAQRRRWLRDKTKRDDVWRLDIPIDRKAGLLRQLDSEFGMSPASRTRVEAEPLVPPVAPPAKATGTEGKQPGRFFRE